MELDCGTYSGLSHSETSRTEEPKKHTKGNPVSSHLWSLFQHGGICLETCLLSVACVLASTGAWRGLCASKWGEWQDKLVVSGLSEDFLSRTVTKTVTWDVRHITHYLQLFLGQGLRQELDMKLPFPLNTVV